MSDVKLAEELDQEAEPLRGDLTQGPILRTLILFSIPALMTNLLQTVGTTVNAIWVGQLLGEGALAATINANMVLFLVISAFFGFGMAATVKIGQHYGARDVHAARRMLGTAMGFCVLTSGAGAALGWIGADFVLHTLATPPEIQDQAKAYLQIIFISMPFTAMSQVISMSLRGVGDAKTPLYAMVLTTVLGIILNPLLILGLGPFPEMGIAGSALALALSSSAGVIMMIIWIYWKDLPLRLRGEEYGYLYPRREELRYVISKGIPMGAQMIIGSLSAVIMIGLVNREGLLTTAAYGAVMQVWNYLQMPAFAISMAVSAMVAQNVGADKHFRVHSVTKAGVWSNIILTGALALFLILFDRPLLALFLGSDSAAIPIAERIQLIATWTYVLMGVTMVVTGTLRAYDQVIVPLLVMVIANFPVRLGFYFLAKPWLGASDAIWWSYSVGALASALMIWPAYRYGPWRKKRLATA